MQTTTEFWVKLPDGRGYRVLLTSEGRPALVQTSVQGRSGDWLRTIFDGYARDLPGPTALQAVNLARQAQRQAQAQT